MSEVETKGRRRPVPDEAPEFECPECGRVFERAASLGAHRRQAHGVAGTSRQRASGATSDAGAKGSAGGTRTRGGRRRHRGSASPSGTRTTGRSENGSGNRRRQPRELDRDRLLQLVFPDGLPAKADALDEIRAWLDESERIARLG